MSHVPHVIAPEVFENTGLEPTVQRVTELGMTEVEPAGLK